MAAALDAPHPGPWLPADDEHRFVRLLPRPGDPVCAAAPPPAWRSRVAAAHPAATALTRCYLPPGHDGGRPHAGLVVTPVGPGHTRLATCRWQDGAP